MFDFGFSEMLVVGVIALVVLGPERLPTVARTAGEWVGKAQRFVAQVKSDIDRESSLAELKKIQEEARAVASDLKSTVEKAATQMEKDVKAVADEVETNAASIEKSVDDAVSQVSSEVNAARTASSEDIASVYGWGTPENRQLGPDPLAHVVRSRDEDLQEALPQRALRRRARGRNRTPAPRTRHARSAVGRRRRQLPAACARTRSNRPRHLPLSGREDVEPTPTT